ncbi:RND transporter [Paracidovorax avenae]|uniref:efflux transporter outer membrane subunit n=1 Tax=Paracidovorax avenae TaxID=80867 RepID=UPI000D17DC18|nr:efflux transporter outer membrane subunit [Paracidovorax avenae]AVT16685.1 RND transporter [Paracidovorax avenae]
MRTVAMMPLLALLSACTLAPPLERPAPPVPAAFPDYGSRAGAAAAAAPPPGTAVRPDVAASELGWRDMFEDPRLQRLIAAALEHNRDLRLAALQAEAVQAQYRIQRSARWPEVALDASASRERGVRAGTGSGAAGVAGAGAGAAVSGQAALSVGVSAFELDLFGRVRSLSDAALARYLASEHGHRAARIALVGAVADAYFAQRLAQEQLRLTGRTLADWRQSLELARLWRQAGQNSGLDVVQAEGQVASAEADLEARQRALDQADNALRLLLGSDPPAGLPEPMPLEARPVAARLPAGLPSGLLLARPDLLQAEQALVAAHADVGAARAAFFPRIALTASVGRASDSLGGLFDAGWGTWRFAPQITQPLFDRGRLRGELRLAQVRRSEAVVQYERAIQVAFREVADALAGAATYGRQIDAQARTVASATRRVELSELRYRAGTEGRLELLDARRQQYAAQQALLDLRRAELGNAVALYKALGGGLAERGPGPVAALQPGGTAP